MEDPGDIELDAIARRVIDTNLYLTLGTVDADGRPWTTPVFFASADYTRFYWASSRESTHSRNLAQRSWVSFVIFDSTVPAYHGQAVYGSGVGVELEGDDLHEGLAVYPGPPARGGSALTAEEASAPSPYRLYRVIAAELTILCPRGPRQPCPRHGLAADHRVPVTPGL